MKSVLMKGSDESMPVGNIFCIGRNYAAHIAELGNAPEEAPLVFLKPTSALSFEETLITLPTFSNEVHYETELVVLLGKDGKNIRREEALDYVFGYGIGLDLTARDVQAAASLKAILGRWPRVLITPPVSLALSTPKICLIQVSAIFR